MIRTTLGVAFVGFLLAALAAGCTTTGGYTGGSGGRGGNRRRCSSHRRRRFVPFMRFPLFVSFEFGKSQFNVQSSGRAKRPVE